MTPRPIDMAAAQSVREMLAVVAPDCRLSAVRPLPGSYSNLTHLVEAIDLCGTVHPYVIRRYVHGDRARKAGIEYAVLAYLQGYTVPVPEPVFLDRTGSVLGSPGIVTRFMPGSLVLNPLEHPAGRLDWARGLAMMLAKIHAVPLPEDTTFLLDGNAEVVWFLKAGTIPAYMSNHPDGEMVWQTVRDWLPRIQPYKPALMHIDYWRGNVLWQQGNIAAVVDWEEAAYGDPGYDAAYCYMELIIMGMIEEAETFLQVYETEMGGAVPNFGIWGLAAAARPMYDFAGWITEPEKENQFRDFIVQAKRKLEVHL